MFKHKKQYIKQTPARLMVYKQSWFYNFGKKIKWMPMKKKLSYIVILLTLVVISSGVIIITYLKQPTGEVLAYYGEGGGIKNSFLNMTVIPGVDAVDFRFATNMSSNCIVQVYSPTSEQNDVTTDMHLFHFTDLNQSQVGDTIPTGYDYKIQCDDIWGTAPTIYSKGTFTTTGPEPGTDIIISGPMVIQDVTTAIFNWDTNISATGKIEIRSSVNGYYNAATSADLSKAHSLLVTGLTAGTEYTYFIVSATSANGFCNPGTTSQVCSATAETTFTTDTGVAITNLITTTGANQVVMSWHTIKPANSWVWMTGQYGEGDNRLVLSHQVTISGLDINKQYTYYVSSGTKLDKRCGDGSVATNGKNCASTKMQSFTTALNDNLDANVILKVNRDRICQQWLYCSEAAQVINNKANPPAREDVCFGVGLCNQMDAGGKCSNIVIPVAEAKETFKATKDNNEVNKIKNLSGYAKVGLDWGNRCAQTGLECTNNTTCTEIVSGDVCVPAKVTGYYPYNRMSEIGLPINVANIGFETGHARPWVSINGAVLTMQKENPQNMSLGVITFDAGSGMTAILADETVSGATYVVSFKAKTFRPEGQQIKVMLNGNDKFGYYNPTEGKVTKYINLTTIEKEYVLSLNSQSTQKDLTISIVADDSNSATFTIDDINMKSVLKVGKLQSYIARSCRMYPDKNSIACSYYDDRSNKDMRGWQGYCVEPDPASSAKGQALCLQWWPVDVIRGESNIFSENKVAGYNGAKPLYYCVESTTSYPYYKHKVASAWSTGKIDNCASTTATVSALNIYRDEIIAVRIDGVQIDDKGDGDSFCALVKKWGSKENPAEEDSNANRAGSLVFNEANKAYWDSGFNEIDSNNFYYNKYASLRCGSSNKDVRANFSTAKLIFTEDNKLSTITYQHCDGSPGQGSGSFSNINITFKGERCNVIAQVVTSDGKNKAWTERIKPGGWVTANELGYTYEQDYAPYGASVTAGLDDDPHKWHSPLYVTPASNGLGGRRPYQVRAGTPYSVSIDELVCDSGPKKGEKCLNNQLFCQQAIQGRCGAEDSAGRSVCTAGNVGIECTGDPSICDLPGEPNARCLPGDGIGKTQCVAGNMNLGQECDNSSDCGGAGGYCAGVKLNNSTTAKLLGGRNAGLVKLNNLFAKVYGVWEWDWDAATSKMAYLPLAGYPVDKSSSMGTDPNLISIKVDDSETSAFEIVGQGAAVLKFTVLVDPNQLPLTGYSVDWDDGTQLVENGLRIDNSSNPHTLVHYYRYNRSCDHRVPNSAGDYCWFKPKITVKDNWGFTSSGSFGGDSENIVIKVYHADTALSAGKLGVTPDNLQFDSQDIAAGNAKIQAFTVSNLNPIGADLHWKVKSADGIFKAVDGLPAVAILGYPYEVGYTGILTKGAEVNVKVTIDNIGNLGIGTHTGVVTIISFDPDTPKIAIDTKIVTVSLTVQ